MSGEKGGSGSEATRLIHDEDTSKAGGRNKGESVGGNASGVSEGISGESMNINTFGKVSFRDKVVGTSSVKALRVAISLIGDQMAQISSAQDDDIPSVDFTPEARAVLSEPYKDAIVIKVLGKHFGYMALVHKLRGVWRIKGGFHVMDVGYGYFIVKFDVPDEREKVLTGGPWTIAGHYLAVKPWCSTFKSCETSFGSTLIWIKISGLSIWYYHENAMMRIVEAIGKPIKVDLATKSADKGRFARACIQINLAQPVKRKIRVDGHVYDIEYENLNLIYEHCNCFGHEATGCSRMNSSSVVDLPKGEVSPVSSEPRPEPVERGDSIFEFGNANVEIPLAKAKESISVTFNHASHAIQSEDTLPIAKPEVWNVVQRKGKKIVESISLAEGGPKDTKQKKLVGATRARTIQPRGAAKPMGPGRVLGGLKDPLSSRLVHCATPVVNNHKRRRPPSLQASPTELGQPSISEVQPPADLAQHQHPPSVQPSPPVLGVHDVATASTLADAARVMSSAP